MEVSRGANLVGMSMMPLDACLFSMLIKKNTFGVKCVEVNTQDSITVNLYQWI